MTHTSTIELFRVYGVSLKLCLVPELPSIQVVLRVLPEKFVLTEIHCSWSCMHPQAFLTNTKLLKLVHDAKRVLT